MMKDQNLDTPLNPRTAELLAKLLKVAEAAQSTIIQIQSVHDVKSVGSNFSLSSVGGTTRADMERVQEQVLGVPSRAVNDLEARGYLAILNDDWHIALNYELAQKRVKYESRGKTGKWWMRATNNWGRFAVDLAGVLGGLWALSDIVRMIIEAL